MYAAANIKTITKLMINLLRFCQQRPKIFDKLIVVCFIHYIDLRFSLKRTALETHGTPILLVTCSY